MRKLIASALNGVSGFLKWINVIKYIIDILEYICQHLQEQEPKEV